MLPGDLLLVDEVGPLVAEAARQRFLEDARDGGLGLAGAVAGGGGAVKVGGAEAVVAHGAVGTVALSDDEQRGERHHLALVVAGLEQADVLGVGAERRIGLDHDLVGAAEFVEVVHVERAEINLQRVEDIGDGDAELLRARAVDIGVELRDVDVEAGEVRVGSRAQAPCVALAMTACRTSLSASLPCAVRSSIWSL